MSFVFCAGTPLHSDSTFSSKVSPRSLKPLIMAAVGEQFCLSLDFSAEKLGPDILWFNPPDKYQLRCDGTSGLKVFSVSDKIIA